LLGFQFVAMLTIGLDRLPQLSKIAHAVALAFIAVNVIILMMPAALHRLFAVQCHQSLHDPLSSCMIAGISPGISRAQLETASHVNEWLTSPGLQSPR
jgi:hypothetical protein